MLILILFFISQQLTVVSVQWCSVQQFLMSDSGLSDIGLSDDFFSDIGQSNIDVGYRISATKIFDVALTYGYNIFLLYSSVYYIIASITVVFLLLYVPTLWACSINLSNQNNCGSKKKENTLCWEHYINLWTTFFTLILLQRSNFRFAKLSPKLQSFLMLSHGRQGIDSRDFDVYFWCHSIDLTKLPPLELACFWNLKSNRTCSVRGRN
jgi:hypothetical protein